MPRRRSAEPRYRRRVVLELTPAESEVLDRQAERYGTIRGAVLAGLRGLEADRSAELEARVGVLTEQLATAKRSAELDRDRATAELGALSEQLAANRNALKAAQAQTKEVRADLRETRAKLANHSSARRAAEVARQAAEALLVHHAYCAACDKLIPEAEWAEQPAERGVYVYHRKDGFHLQSSLLQRPTVLFWRAQSSAGGEP